MTWPNRDAMIIFQWAEKDRGTSLIVFLALLFSGKTIAFLSLYLLHAANVIDHVADPWQSSTLLILLGYVFPLALPFFFSSGK